jgi:two-component system, NarL family, nitrate/nitrite response regulator NarL
MDCESPAVQEAGCAPALGAVRILIVDDHTLFREGLKALLCAQRHVDVVGDCGNVADALRLAMSAEPHVILLDLKLGAEDGLDAIGPLKIAAPQAEVLVVTGRCSCDRVSQALL